MSDAFEQLRKIEERLKKIATESGMKVIEVIFRTRDGGMATAAVEELPKAKDAELEAAFQDLVKGFGEPGADEQAERAEKREQELRELRKRMQRGGDIL